MRIVSLIGVLTTRKHKHFDRLYDRLRHSLNRRRFVERALAMQELSIGNEREGEVSARHFVRAANS